MSSTADEALQRLNSGMTCSQAVLSIFCEKYNLPMKTAMKVASGFAGGVGMTGNVCGAATAGVMILGLALAPDDKENRRAMFDVFGKSNDFLGRFRDIHGTEHCSDITGIEDMAAPDVPQYFEDHPEIKARCAACVKGATSILEDMLG